MGRKMFENGCLGVSFDAWRGDCLLSVVGH